MVCDLLEFARSRKLRLTIITSERVNEWNVRCDCLEEYLSDKYQLHYLNHTEVERLVHLLEKYNSLGPNLVKKSFKERVKEFEEKAGRQLLVVLHEATHGRPFEEILLDEYNNIIPLEAQRLYLTVCVLNRLKVPVRAGLISRVHGIPFEKFSTRLFKPLEHVVDVVSLPWGDFAYQARHSEIAQIVFEQVLIKSADRFNEYIRIIGFLNPTYSTDHRAIRGMLRAKIVNELFPEYQDAKEIYKAAEKILGNDAYLFQQMANYERIRPKGNLVTAQMLLDKARKLDPFDSTIIHTMAETFRTRAEKSNKILERARFRSEARSLLRSIKPADHAARYALVTKFKLCIDEVRDLLADKSSTDIVIDNVMREAEKAFEEAKQRFPGDEFVYTTEADYAQLLKNNERSFQALKKARDSNPRDPFIASRLSSVLVSRGDPDTALKYLAEALKSNPGDKRLNFQYAELLRAKKETSIEDLIFYYRRSFAKWDNNYESQFWYARFAFESKDDDKLQESKEVFKNLRETPMRYLDRIHIKDAIGGLDKPELFSGTIINTETAHGFVKVDGRGFGLFFHETDVVDGIWKHLLPETRVVFFIGFNFRGPKAINLRLEKLVV
jgi:tetratricopeptide (TPR) repeat protein